MVKVAIAGASSSVAKEVVDALILTNKHEILLLYRKVFSTDNSYTDLKKVEVDYENKEQLRKALTGVHTVLSFIASNARASISQRNLIDVAISAGVKRFAPSEWATSNFEYLPWYADKAEIREYLKEVNSERKVLEYCLFQPGQFTNYLAHPYQTAKHFRSFENMIDFQHRRALVREGGEDDGITLTTLQDFVSAVTRAVQYDGEWPIVGGIKGTELTIKEVIALGEKIRGGRFQVERLDTRDLLKGEANSTWLPTVEHPRFSIEEAKALAQKLLAGVLMAISKGAFKVTDEWNQLLPDYSFTHAEDFLNEVWLGKE